IELRLDRLQAEAAPETAKKGRLRCEAPGEPVALAKARHRPRPAEPLERDHVEALALQAPHHLVAPLLANARRPLGFRDERSRPQDWMAVAEERVRVRHALVRSSCDPEHRFPAPNVLEREREPVDLDPVAALDQPDGLLGVALR